MSTPTSSSIGTINGGRVVIRRRPCTTVVIFPIACRLHDCVLWPRAFPSPRGRPRSAFAVAARATP